jgi:hypothetical protein
MIRMKHRYRNKGTWFYTPSWTESESPKNITLQVKPEFLHGGPGGGGGRGEIGLQQRMPLADFQLQTVL